MNSAKTACPESLLMLFPNTVHVLPRFLRLLTLGLTAFCYTAMGQDQPALISQPIPYTALLDFAVLRHPAAPKQSLPIWLESVQIVPALTPTEPDVVTTGLPEEQVAPHTVYRIRLRPMPGLNDLLLMRVFFEDRADVHPTVTGWSETGEQRFASAPLGAGLGLPASESLSIPTQGVDYLEIDVPGDGSTLSKALLTTLKKTTVSAALDFAPVTAQSAAAPVADPFGNATPQTPPTNDTYLFGRVRAMLEPGVVKLTPTSATTAATTSGTDTAPQTSVSFEFDLESAPLLAFVALDILDVDPLAPLQAWVNGTSLGSVTPQFPDLADPAYVGLVRPLEAMRFRYAGWVHAQLIVPGSTLRTGTNTLILQLPADASPAAIRAIELQLKHNWRTLDYTLAP